jgi:hypothetical protein
VPVGGAGRGEGRSLCRAAEHDRQQHREEDRDGRQESGARSAGQTSAEGEGRSCHVPMVGNGRAQRRRPGAGCGGDAFGYALWSGLRQREATAGSACSRARMVRRYQVEGAALTRLGKRGQTSFTTRSRRPNRRCCTGVQWKP